MDYLEQNIDKLLSSIEPELKIPADRKAEILSKLLSESAVVEKQISIRIIPLWLKLAAAAIIIIGVLIAGLYLLRPQTPVIQPQRIVQQQTPGTAPSPQNQLADERKEVDRLFVAKDVAGLVSMLEKGLPETQIAAANYLAQVGDESAIAPLQKLGLQWNPAKGENPFSSAIEKIMAGRQQQPADINAVPSQEITGKEANEAAMILEHKGPGIVVFVVDKLNESPIADANVHADISLGPECSSYTELDRRTNRYGFCFIDFNMAIPQYLSLKVNKAGCVPMMFAWQEDMEIPDEFTFKLEKGTSVGGRVVDEDGIPVEGVEVKLDNYENESKEQPWIMIRDYIVKTDADGKWSTDIIPAKLDEINYILSHPDYAVDHVTYTIGSTGKPTIEQLRSQTAVMVIKRGVIVTGTVIDTAGRPIPGAAIIEGQYRYGEAHKTQANQQGKFELSNVSTAFAPVMLLVAAEGFAPQLQKLSPRESKEPVQLVLGPGGKISGRVVDVKENPVANARVTCEEWRGFNLLDWQTQTDSSGRFVWQNCPEDEILISVLKQGYTTSRNLPLTASEEEYKIVLYDPLLVTGAVVDANNGKPIEKFTVIPGVAWKKDQSIAWQDGPYMHWSKDFTGGKFQYPFTFGGYKYAVKIRAEGFLDANSPDFNVTEKQGELEISLQKANLTNGTVLLPDGNVASEAIVFVVKKSRSLFLENNKPTNSLRYAEHAVADASGRFSIKPQGEPYKLVVVHPQGWADVSQSDFEQSGEIHLGKCGRVVGTVYIGPAPAVKTIVTLYNQRSQNDPNGLDYFMNFNSVTDANGHFVMEQVPTGKMRLARRILGNNDQAISSSGLGELEVLPGQTTQCSFGGGGRTVIGKLTAPADITVPCTWNTFITRIRGKGPSQEELAKLYEQVEFPRPENFDRMTVAEVLKWYMQWAQSEQGRKIQKEMTNKLQQTYGENVLKDYGLVVADDNSFTSVDITPGSYVLDVIIFALDQDNLPDYRNRLGRMEYEFVVPKLAPGEIDTPVNLGTIPIELQKETLAVGDKLPQFEARTIDGVPIQLSDYSGKVLLISIWNGLAAIEGDAEIESIKAVYRQNAGKNFDVLTVTGLVENKLLADIVKKYTNEKQIPWRTAYVGSDVLAKLTAMSGNILIGSDGAIIAAGLKGPELEAAITKALAH